MAPTSQQMDWVTQRNRKDKVVEMMKQGDWRRVIQEFQGEDQYREPLLVWIRPSVSSLEFVKIELTKLGLTHVSSVGCGCGTLEWLLHKATGNLSLLMSNVIFFILMIGLTVTGYEVNRIWWEGEHSTPHFIDIGQKKTLSWQYLMLYFQNMLMKWRKRHVWFPQTQH